jgi:hypothetical protein
VKRTGKLPYAHPFSPASGVTQECRYISKGIFLLTFNSVFRIFNSAQSEFLKINEPLPTSFAGGIGLKYRDLFCDTEFLGDFLLENSGRLNCVERVRRKGWKKFSSTPKSL